MNNQRLILLLVFFFSIMMLWDAWLRHGQPAQPATTAQEQGAQSKAGGASSAAVPSAPTFAAAPGAVPVPGSAAVSPTVTGAAVVKVKTDLVVAEISAQGGDLVRLELLHHHATENKKENFILLDTAHFYSAQSGLIGAGLPNHKSVWRLPAAALALKEGENELRVALEA
ncbi:MAG: membrane protein insertase YidC, partial [Rhodocyclaceae bacterium]|nr:membrane protein insertase YidC [Rhodocyclaceae bacterium]